MMKMWKLLKNWMLNIIFRKAWNQCEIKNINGEPIAYNSKKNGLNEPLPNFCIKVPTGGGRLYLLREL